MLLTISRSPLVATSGAVFPILSLTRIAKLHCTSPPRMVSQARHLVHCLWLAWTLTFTKAPWLDNYEDGSLKSERQESIKLDRPNNAREKKHIKTRKSNVKREVKKFEQTRGGPP